MELSSIVLLIYSLPFQFLVAAYNMRRISRRVYYIIAGFFNVLCVLQTNLNQYLYRIGISRFEVLECINVRPKHLKPCYVS